MSETVENLLNWYFINGDNKPKLLQMIRTQTKCDIYLLQRFHTTSLFYWETLLS